jgi:hypothetical protein
MKSNGAGQPLIALGSIINLKAAITVKMVEATVKLLGHGRSGGFYFAVPVEAGSNVQSRKGRSECRAFGLCHLCL